MKLQLLLPIALIVLFASCANRSLKDARKHCDNYEFAAAATIYEAYLKEKADQTVMLSLADCYRQMNQDSAAEYWYAKGISSSATTSEDKLHYAEVLRSVGKDEEAKAVYHDHVLTNPGDHYAKTQMRSCDSAAHFRKENIMYEAFEADFGFGGSCFSAVPLGDQLLVTAEAPSSDAKAASTWTGRGYLDLYVVSDANSVASVGGNNNDPANKMNITAMKGDVNSALHEGPAVVSPDGKTLFFTRSGFADGKAIMADNRTNHLELCKAELSGENWTNVSSMGFNNVEYSCGHPALANNGQRLYFISDMPGGYGGTDIYFSDFVNGQWNTPENAGGKINTVGDEMFPTVSNLPTEPEQLYFSSNGMVGAGGLDIFRCAAGGTTPCNPVRLTAPFNSSGDDFGLVYIDNANEGYFSSDRSTADGIDKVFRFRKMEPQFVVNFSVIDKETQLPVPNTEVDVFDGSDNSTKKMMTDNTGHLIFDADSLTGYGFTLRCQDYFCGYISGTTGGFEGKLHDTTFLVASIERIVLNKAVRLDNIYYDFDKWNIRADAGTELDKLVKIMVDNPGIKIELSSHTDSRGTDPYNMKLSQKRAQSAVDYIVSKGVGKDRIYAKGYGESVPLNKCTNGKKCSDEEFQFNRRTEFKVVEVAK